MAEAARQDEDRAMQFATALAHGVGDFDPADLEHDALTLTFGLSAWMRRCAVGFDEAWEGVLMLREALLEVAGLDRTTEPVPLRASDPRTALVSTTVYLDGLVARAVRLSGKTRATVVSDAVDLLMVEASQLSA